MGTVLSIYTAPGQQGQYSTFQSSSEVLRSVWFSDEDMSGVVVAEGELELLPCTHEDVWVQLSSVERAMYERTRDAVESGLRYSGVKRRGNASSSAHKK